MNFSCTNYAGFNPIPTVFCFIITYSFPHARFFLLTIISRRRAAKHALAVKLQFMYNNERFIHLPTPEAIDLYLTLKRALDFLLSLLALIVLSPILLVIAATIKATSPGPVFFKQKRVGLGKTHFMIYKFRTMRTDAPKDAPTHLLQNAQNFITPVGRFLRASSLDELPQLFNILKGEMSIVGPRPALWNQYDLIAERDKYRANDVLPGLTGWAQINGRDELPIDVKAKLDGEYVSRMSLGFDLRCILGTVLSVLRHDGVREGAAEPSKKEEKRDA